MHLFSLSCFIWFRSFHIDNTQYKNSIRKIVAKIFKNYAVETVNDGSQVLVKNEHCD